MRFFKSLVCSSLLGLSLAHGGEVLTQLDVDASMDVNNNEMSVVLLVSKDGPQPSPITQEVLEKLTAAVARCKPHADIERKVSQVSTTPVWGPNGKTSMWSAQASIELTSTNVNALSRLASELTDVMQIDHISYRLSSSRVADTERLLLKDLAANFDRKAKDLTTAFGFKRHEIKSLNFSQQSQPMPHMRMAMASPRAMADGAAPVPIPADSGKTTVSVRMSAQIGLWP